MAVNKIKFKVAQEIVDAVKEVVDKNINFIDINGTIIASTDEDRINTFHEAGYKAISTLKNITVNEDEEYKGAKKGINYPILINNEAIGAIGITGEPDEVSKFGFLVTKITEIFIKEQQLNYKYESDKQRINHVVKSLIYDSIEDKNEIETILNEFGIGLKQKFAVVIFKITKYNDVRELEKVENDVQGVLKDIGNIFKIYVYPNEFIALVNEERYNNLRKIYMNTLRKYEGILTGGVGRLKELYDTHKSYSEARSAIKYSAKNHEILTYFDSLSLELILEGIDEDIKKQYVDKVLRELENSEIELLQAFYRNDMSLKNTSEELFIHKNTLQYRLEKIGQKTGFNPRCFKEAIIFYLALRLKS
ncbi:MAG: sugar diacid recognition domain-containing protein [Clostridium sp.]|nr:sugar diacid recognition domain-containing protein [Clostridium sp.]MDU7084102.1 sugar diacid recognition domain-containing protein [Clostridium sp.]